MLGTDDIEATRRIAEARGRSRILVPTAFDVDGYAHAALRAGAGGFLLKDARPERERETLVAVGKGWTDGEIGTRFIVTESTVKAHVGRPPCPAL